ncbi:hypothetical protein C8035_v009459 [Colletotrichum spinosum]|uniref:Glutathione S-transferase-like protein ustS n=1 Tax=Colletotrichum spinosum TaxID=1347390 RepID=A0A4R8PTU5_9PEZI|nr:hypothetical protein C8035_v009459 [Colletotrichum spinosum]
MAEITFYDIILDPAAYPMSPNPWKTRYALNFAKVPYRTTWVPLSQIPKTRDSLRLSANRKHMDGTDFPTLPIIHDHPTSAGSSGGTSGGEAVVGDTFDIALHLQNTYLRNLDKAAQLFPGDGGGGTVALHRAFNAFVDQIFTFNGAPLGGCYMPFDPRTAEADKADMVSRFPGKTKWEEFEVPPGTEAREKMVRDFEEVLETKLGPCYPSSPGPFLDGRETPMYADFIVGGWLQFMRGCLPEWDELRNKWSGGKWGRLFDALEEWTDVDGRDGVVPKRR